MKNLLNYAIAFAIVTTTCLSCSVEQVEIEATETALDFEQPAVSFDVMDPCDNQDPQARITNNGTTSVTLEIANMEGTILHTVTDLAPGNASGYLTFAPDTIIFSVTKSVTGVGDDKVSHEMTTCMSFDMEVGPDNVLLPSVPFAL